MISKSWVGDGLENTKSVLLNRVLVSISRLVSKVRQVLLPMETDEDWRYRNGHWTLVNRAQIDAYYEKMKREKEEDEILMEQLDRQRKLQQDPSSPTRRRRLLLHKF